MHAYVLNLKRIIKLTGTVAVLTAAVLILFSALGGKIMDKLWLQLMKREVLASEFPVIYGAYPSGKNEDKNLLLELLLDGNTKNPVKAMVSSHPIFAGIKERLSEMYNDVYESNGFYIPGILKPEKGKTVIPVPENVYDAPEITAKSVIENGTPLEGMGVTVKNQTDASIDLNALFYGDTGIKYAGGKPQVLIVHTHGSESFNPDDRNRDTEKNIVKVGTEMARVFEENGIGVIHSPVMHDIPSYNSSYKRSMETVTKTLAENPGINIVLDVHRDAMASEDGKNYKTVCELDGKKAAQVMFVVGTDRGGLSHPQWRENLKLAMKFQAAINERCKNLARPINLRTERFNQQTSKGSLIIEVGTNGNTLDEAVRAGIAAAEAMSKVIKGL